MSHVLAIPIFKLLLIFLFLSSNIVHADDSEPLDHPLFSGYNDIKPAETDWVNYLSVTIPTVIPETHGVPLQTREITGKVSVHTYQTDNSHSHLAVAENYRQAIAKLEGSILLECDKSSCDDSFFRALFDDTWMTTQVIGSFSIGDIRSDSAYIYILAKLGSDSAPTYVQWIVNHNYRELAVFQVIVEPQVLQTDLVRVDPAKLKSKREFSEIVEADGEDIVGSQDHPLISRYQGAKIRAYKQAEYAEYRLAKGVSDSDNNVPHDLIEGRLTSLVYEAPSRQSTLQIERNYASVLKKSGFQTVFSCVLVSCGEFLLRDLWQGSAEEFRFTPMDVHSESDPDIRMLTAKLDHQGADSGKTIYLSVVIMKARLRDSATIAVDVIETEKMDNTKVVIDTEYLSRQLVSHGRVTLHGLHFAFDKATLTPASSPALITIANYLAANPSQKFYVVGHTDNVGDEALNIKLSEQRAAAVVQALLDKKVQMDQLKPVGVGAVAPATSNREERGRQKNRRVELVLQ